MSEIKTYTLSVILIGFKKIIDEKLKNKRFWLKAEISNISFHRNGHCYLELTETKNGVTIAQIKANIWNYNILNIQNDLGSEYGNILKKGSDVLLYSELTYHEIFGLQINITSVDKSFSIGELERKKQETIIKLQNENLIEKNKKIIVPIIIQKIALIGSPNTSGHTDFLKQIKKNEYGFDFKIDEYHCQVQGEKVESEILFRLNEIKNKKYDVVVIVRGGGSKLDLEPFNSFNIAKEIANFPTAIFTGIGHETDISVVDLVANKNFKTPSAVGSYIIDKAYQFYVKITSNYNYIMEYYKKNILTYKKDLFANTQYLNEKAVGITRLKRGDLHTYSNRLLTNIRERLNQEKSLIRVSIETINSLSKFGINESSRNIDEVKEIMKLYSNQLILNKVNIIKQNTNLIIIHSKTKLNFEKNWLQNIEEIPSLYNPINILKKGYALVRLKEHIVTSDTNVIVGDEIEIELISNKLYATVTKNIKNGRA